MSRFFPKPLSRSTDTTPSHQNQQIPSVEPQYHEIRSSNKACSQMHSLLSTRNGETQRLSIEDRHVGFASSDARDLIKKAFQDLSYAIWGLVNCPTGSCHHWQPEIPSQEYDENDFLPPYSPPCRPQTAQTVELDKVLGVILNQPWPEFSIDLTEPKPVATAIARESIRDDDDEVYLPGYSPSRTTMQPVGWPPSSTASDSNRRRIRTRRIAS